MARVFFEIKSDSMEKLIIEGKLVRKKWKRTCSESLGELNEEMDDRFLRNLTRSAENQETEEDRDHTQNNVIYVIIIRKKII